MAAWEYSFASLCSVDRWADGADGGHGGSAAMPPIARLCAGSPGIERTLEGAAALSRAGFALLQEQNPRIGREQGCVGTGYSLAVITTELKPTAVPVIGDAGCGAG